MALRQYETTDSGIVARSTGKGRFQTELNVRGKTLLVDEPVEVGGDGTGPTPYELLSGALAACTAMTLRLYAERKGWTLPPLSVEVAHSIFKKAGDERPRDRFARHIAFDGPIDEAQKAKLIEIANKCPVHRTFMNGFDVPTEIGPPNVHPAGEPPTRHEEEMEAACAD
ncbi:OsmC family protein [Sphingosinicella sp. CPCC 101087]|uniref:OsmC family protein n=1 Tax=Sphingosinicella sp. CPCC 101087 TaxID=2497754 RepID=UPI00101DB6D9|nr:OsmC family protein [Sphingosinicella sp. CPCC 101087]